MTVNSSIENMVTVPPFYKHLSAEKKCSIVLAPFSGGQPKQGCDLGPKFLLEHGLEQQIQELGWETKILSPLDSVSLENADPKTTEDKRHMKNLPCVGSATKAIYETCKNISNDDFQLTIGGDHSVAMGTVSGLLSRVPNAGLIWIDAHADINTGESTESGNLHGCPASFLLGLEHDKCPPELQWIPKEILKKNKLVYIGLRDVDEPEKKILRENNIKAFSMYHVDRFGINKVVEMAMEHVQQGDSDCPLMITYDVDGLEPSFVKCTGTMVQNGLTLREGYFICERVAETGNLVALDVVEVNPSLGTNDVDILDTIAAGSALTRCALGETLL